MRQRENLHATFLGTPLPKRPSGHPPPPHHGPGGGSQPPHTSHPDFRGELGHPQPRCLLCAPAPCSTAVVAPRDFPFQQQPHNRHNSPPLHLQPPQTDSPPYSCHTPLGYIQSSWVHSCWEPHSTNTTPRVMGSSCDFLHDPEQSVQPGVLCIRLSGRVWAVGCCYTGRAKAASAGGLGSVLACSSSQKGARILDHLETHI